VFLLADRQPDGEHKKSALIYRDEFFIDDLCGAIEAGIILIKNPIIFWMILIGTYVEISQSGYCA
jgi:hypothetical protein